MTSTPARSATPTTTRTHSRLPYGAEDWKSIGVTPPADCYECGTSLGGFHHAGCEVADCAHCLHPTVTCACEVLILIGEGDSPHPGDPLSPWDGTPLGGLLQVFAVPGVRFSPGPGDVS